VNLRRVEPADVPALLAITHAGMETYGDFAPPGWKPPVFHELDTAAIDDVAFWVLAEEDGEPVGHALFIPAARSREPVDDPRLGHVLQLFVRESHWGSGVARALDAALVEEAPRRGFTELRLFTPEGQRRARRFYERQGWRDVRRVEDTPLGFPVVEYRRTCPTQS
jgi:GNAT superfamily N-acetyltransferase